MNGDGTAIRMTNLYICEGVVIAERYIQCTWFEGTYCMLPQTWPCLLMQIQTYMHPAAVAAA